MNDVELSPRGRARRAQILNMAIQQVRRRRRRRLALRGGAVGIVLLAIGLAVLRMPRLVPNPSKTTERSITDSTSPSVPAPKRTPTAKVVIEHIQTDPTITRRLAVAQAPPRWQRLDDDQVLQELERAGKPAGLVKINGQVLACISPPFPLRATRKVRYEKPRIEARRASEWTALASKKANPLACASGFNH